MSYLFRIFIIISTLLLTMCTTIQSSRQTVPAHARWGIVPFTNNTEVPQAGYRAMSITQGLLEVKGIKALQVYKSNETCNQLIACPNATPSLSTILAWARHHSLQFVMTGAVNEWGYKVGLDGEPVTSVTLQLYEVRQGRMIWSSVGSKFGTTRSGLGNTGQKLLREMLCTLIVAK